MGKDINKNREMGFYSLLLHEKLGRRGSLYGRVCFCLFFGNRALMVLPAPQRCARMNVIPACPDRVYHEFIKWLSFSNGTDHAILDSI